MVDSYGFGLLFEERPTLEIGALMNRLRRDTTVELVSASDEVIQLAHPDHLVSVVTGGFQVSPTSSVGPNLSTHQILSPPLSRPSTGQRQKRRSRAAGTKSSWRT